MTIVYTDTANAKNQGVYWEGLDRRRNQTQHLNHIITEEDSSINTFGTFIRKFAFTTCVRYIPGIVMLPQHRNTAELLLYGHLLRCRITENVLFTRIETLPRGEYLCVNYKEKKDKKSNLDLQKHAIEKNCQKWPTLCKWTCLQH